MSEINLLYCPCKDLSEAEKIGKTLLEAKMVACVNLVGGVSSLYWWEGKIQEDKEVILLAKSLKSSNHKIEELITKVHSYECPCVAFFEISEINFKYLTWLKNSLSTLS